MNTIRLTFILILLTLYQVGISQDTTLYADRFTEMTTEQDKMMMYLDTIEKYVYRDIDLTSRALSECQKIVDKGVLLSDSILLDYAISQIYFAYNKASPLDAFEIIMANESLVESNEVDESSVKSFNYLKRFALYSLGDLEAAQKEYYKAIEHDEMAKDTSSLVLNLHSLGQLYSDEEDFGDAISCFLQINEIAKSKKLRNSTLVLNNIQLCEAYMGLKKYDKALSALDRADEISEKENLEILKSDVLFHRGNIMLKQNKIDAAELIYKQLLVVNKGTQDVNNIMDTDRFLGNLYSAKKMYPQSLQQYKKILDRVDSTNLDLRIQSLENAYKVSQKMNDYKSAFEYVIAGNEIKAKKTADEKRQKTAYLKIKYESEQKERDNAILSAELVKNQAERNFLYALIALSLAILAILFGAFYQKGRYNKRLEAEVQKRTVKLRESNELLNKTNEELDEFNRILSHDLKEPLRSIVSFSQLAIRNLSDTEKVREYLNIVVSSGGQLNQLIEDVNIFQNTNTIDESKHRSVDVQKMLDNIVQQVQKNYPDRELRLQTNTIPKLVGTTETLKAIFQNLIDNAVKYNKQSIAQININYELKDEMHQFKVEDNGIGIAPEYHKRIFEMFKRLNVRDVYTDTGSGLGLSIVKKLIEKIGGTISLLRSQEDQGSTFLFSFPVSRT